MLGITQGAAERIKPGVDEGSGLVVSGGSFEGTFFSYLEGSGLLEGDPVGNLEVTRVGNKVIIFYVEVLGITLRVAERSKLGGREGGIIHRLELPGN